jgi:hypothetical protein
MCKNKLLPILLLLVLATPTFAKAKSKTIEWALLKTLKIENGDNSQFKGLGAPPKKEVKKKKKAKVKAPIPSKELKAILGKSISLKGFMMPMDYSAKKIVEFLLMPYIPSCMHIPPPPSNQIILVKMKGGSKIAPSYYPVEVKGIISIEENKEFESTFKMDATKVIEIKE